MIPRRTFLGALGAAGLTSAATPQLWATPWIRPTAGDLKWQCDLIETLVHPSTGRSPVVTGVCLQPQGPQIAIVGDDHYVGIYDLENRRYQQHFRAHEDWIRAANYSPSGKLLATAGNDRHLKIWDVADWQRPQITKTHSSAIIDLAFAHQGNQLATVGFSDELRIYDTEAGQLAGTLDCPCNDNHAVCYSADDRWLAVGGRSGVIKIWESATGRVLVEQPVHRQRIRSLVFTDNHWLVSAGDDQQIKIMDPNQPDQIRSLPRQSAKLFAVTLLSYQRLATAGSDNRIHIWNLANQELLGWLEGHTGTVSSLDAMPDKMVSGSFDTQVRLWHPAPTNGAPDRQTELTPQWQGRRR